MAVAIVAGKIAAQLILQVNVGDVVPPARGERERGRDIEGVGRVGAVGLIDRLHAHRHRIAELRRGARIFRRIDDQAGRLHQQLRIEHPDLSAAVEIRQGIVNSRPGDELIGVAEERLAGGGLHGGAATIGVDQLEIIFPDQHRPALGDIRQNLSGGVGERRESVRLTQRSRGVHTGGVVGGITVGDALRVLTVIEHAL